MTFAEANWKRDLSTATKMIEHRAEVSALAAGIVAARAPSEAAAASVQVFKHERRQPAASRRSRALPLISFCHYYLMVLSSIGSPSWAQQVASFPGVSRDLASFCSARPSLSIDLASMVVHVKKATSFNYKLYLFSSDNYVFQTGQIVPRDDFRIHSFPVKVKPFNEFLPADVPTFQQTEAGQLAPVVSGKFNAKAFFSQVQINPAASGRRLEGGRHASAYLKRQQRELEEREPSKENRKRRKQQQAHAANFEAPERGDILPGDESSSAPFGHHDVALAQARLAKQSATPNSNVHFDRDDQVALLGARSLLHDLSRRETNASPGRPASIAERMSARAESSSNRAPSNFAAEQQMVMPVGAFSSFHVNTTYFVRKDFGQSRPELVRLQINAHKFAVTQVHLLDMPQADNASTVASASQLDDHAFLKHKLLNDPNTRITSINQIYEDWITRNFYTIVYIQRQLEAPERQADARTPSAEELDQVDESSAHESRNRQQDPQPDPLIVTHRLIFRGSSPVLLGADELDYEVKASAFITEKNGLHYYFEFLTQGKFYVGAIDWSRRPFAIIDAQRSPLRQTKTKFDNEELLLCPPSVCYSERPIDELVSYGRLGLPEKLAREAAFLTRALSARSGADAMAGADRPRELLSLSSGTLLVASNRTIDEQDHELSYGAPASSAIDKQPAQGKAADGQQWQSRDTSGRTGEMISLDELVESVRTAASQLEVRLHLRDWTWSLPRVTPRRVANKSVLSGSPSSRYHSSNVSMASDSSPPTSDKIAEPSSWTSAFAWHFEWARRNDIKVSPDTYGFVLTGHDIDASYRVYDELHLVSANHLITINYTLANETVTSAQPIGDQFQGLSSTLLDPITGAFYDRYANQLYFFKGDRYVGYDYATKRPLEDFLLPPAVDALVPAPSGNPMLQAALGGAPAPAIRSARHLTQPLVSSLPVVGILGRQHYVDAIWHDLHEDLVYVFEGAKFYAFHASDFKDGAFRTARQPAFRCANEHFLEGCRFDEAFPNPCHEPESIGDSIAANEVEVDAKQGAQVASNSSAAAAAKNMRLSKLTAHLQRELEFDEQQQTKLRSIAARGSGLLDVLLGNTLAAAHGDGALSGVEPLLVRAVAMPGAGGLSAESTPQERIVIYLLIAMVLITIVITVAMIFVILSWGRAQARSELDEGDSSAENLDEAKRGDPTEHQTAARTIHERIAYPPAIRQYLTNQYHQHQLHQPVPYQHQYARRQQVPLNFMPAQQANYNGTVAMRRQSQPPLPEPPESQLFQSLSQMVQTTANSSKRSPAKRHDNIVDSSAL